MAAPQKILDLAARFEENKNAYHAGSYSESELRTEFIDPLFEALGWDIANIAALAEQYKDVVREASVDVEGQAKKPDYEFRIGGTRKFYVEAKKPSVNLKDDIAPAFQLRRYAWSAKLPLGITTDFEEMAIYDCRTKPKATDAAGIGRIHYYSFKDYVEKWDEIAAIFSKDAILKGAFDKYAASDKKRGTQTVDDAFLTEIESWRQILAKDIARRNGHLTVEQLNYAVQQTIDRIIFLRICEDRGIESYGDLQKIAAGKDVYSALLKHFLNADERYNSGLFHFKKEKDNAEAPDDLTPSLTIDDKAFKDIIKNLYYPNCPYEFSVISADILGQVYERFLGKVIRLTSGHQAKVEDKPEVKKAGGVYYTPTYIVDYIVKNTIGKLVEGKAPKDVDKIKVLDPACGSGSFLIGAYQFLLDWYLEYYSNHEPAKLTKGSNPKLVQAQSGWKLSLPERRRILLNNIHGVDIDGQAVEVTKLSLLLKVLESETQQKLFDRRVLPDLSANIKCGNSLICTDYFADKLIIDSEELALINPMDWNQVFSEVMNGGGFDAVIGNPPYVFTRNNGISKSNKEYFYANYSHQSAQLNLFGLFIEKSLSLAGAKGYLGFITPNNWLTIDSFLPLRTFILEKTGDLEVINISSHVFKNAQVDTAIFICSNKAPTNISIGELDDEFRVALSTTDVGEVKGPNYIFSSRLGEYGRPDVIVDKISRISVPLGDTCTVSTGLKAYQIGKGTPKQTDAEKQERIFHSREKISSSYQPYLQGADVKRYLIDWSGEYLSYGKWLAEPRRSVPFTGERVLVRQIPSKTPYLINAAFVEDSFLNDINSMVVFNPINGISLKYLLSLVNSKLLSYWFMATYDKLKRKIFPQFKVKELASFPIKIPASEAEKKLCDRIMSKVDQQMTLLASMQTAGTQQAKVQHDRQADAINKQIDQIVYELYGLTEEEIKIVEG